MAHNNTDDNKLAPLAKIGLKMDSPTRLLLSLRAHYGQAFDAVYIPANESYVSVRMPE